MLAKAIAVLAVMAFFLGTVFGFENSAIIQVGDHIGLRLSGKLAEEYSRRIGVLKPDQKPQPGLQLETTGTVCQVSDNDQIRIECSLPVVARGKKESLITLTAIVDAKEIRADISPKGTPIYSSPDDKKRGINPVSLDHDVRSLKLELSDLKHIKLRTWTLAEEIGE